jgi:uncharacterized membrane protein YqgA involved in biofilm formation
MWIATLKQAKRLVVALVGVTIVGIGIAMIVLPGPAIIVIPVGLGVLATEFVWARKLLHDLKARFARRGNNGATATAGSGTPSPSPFTKASADRPRPSSAAAKASADKS